MKPEPFVHQPWRRSAPEHRLTEAAAHAADDTDDARCSPRHPMPGTASPHRGVAAVTYPALDANAAANNAALDSQTGNSAACGSRSDADPTALGNAAAPRVRPAVGPAVEPAVGSVMRASERSPLDALSAAERWFRQWWPAVAAAVIGSCAFAALAAAATTALVAVCRWLPYMTGLYGHLDMASAGSFEGTTTVTLVTSGLTAIVSTAVLAAGSLNQVIDNIRGWVMGILAAAATLFLTVGGLRYLAAGGDPSEVEKAKIALKSAAIGYCLAMLSPLLMTVLGQFVR